MISGQKILITGASGTLGGMLGRFLAKENEVWGMARLSDDAAKTKLSAERIISRRVSAVRPMAG
jgi:UDP-glucuronate 4-epimerase